MSTATASALSGGTPKSKQHPTDQTRRPRPTGRAIVLLLLSITAVVAVSRVPVAPRYLFSFDNVNFALALDHFDPWRAQPQPPGYPLFIAEARFLRLFCGTPERTFVVCSLLAGVVAPLLLFFLGAQMYSRWAGVAAALLLAVNPAFWHSTLASPLRPYLAVVTTLVAYLCHRAAGGEPRFAYYAAIALGLGGGWRPVLMVLLLPLGLTCAWLALRSVRRMALAALLFVAAVLVWFIPLVTVVGGPLALVELFSGYLGEQSQSTSPVYGAGFWEWWRMMTQAFVWQALAVVGWFWAALLLLLPRRQAARPWGNSNPAGPLPNWAFILLWVGPAALFFKLIHVASPGHILSLVPALCLLGGASLEWGAMRAGEFLPRGYAPRSAFLAAALAINFGFFTYPFRIPHARPQVRGTLAQVIEQFRFWGYFALRDSSYASIRGEDLRTADRIRLLRSLGTANHLTIVWQDDDVTWRKIAYYFPTTPVWVVEGVSGSGAVPTPVTRLWLRDRILEAPGPNLPISLRLPAEGRVAWLFHLHSPFPQELRDQGVPLRQFGSMYVTDLSQAPPEFHAGQFLFQKRDR